MTDKRGGSPVEKNVSDLWFDFAMQFVDKKNLAGGDWGSLTEAEQEVAALWLLEGDMYNGGFLQFFCNWGYEAYLHAVRALNTITAPKALAILTDCYEVIDAYKDDPRLEALWDIPKVLTEEESDTLEDQDEQFWEDEDKLSEKAYAHYYLSLQLKP